jgi:hypothetical protein
MLAATPSGPPIPPDISEAMWRTRLRVPCRDSLDTWAGGDTASEPERRQEWRRGTQVCVAPQLPRMAKTGHAILYVLNPNTGKALRRSCYGGTLSASLAAITRAEPRPIKKSETLS